MVVGRELDTNLFGAIQDGMSAFLFVFLDGDEYRAQDFLGGNKILMFYTMISIRWTPHT
jgi:hypothetical protein